MNRIEEIVMQNKEIPKKVILWGGTGQAKVVRPILEYYGSRVDAVIDDTVGLKSPFSDVKVYEGYNGFLEYIKDKIPEETGFVVTIGNNKTCKNAEARIRIGKMLRERGLVPVTVIHPTAYIDSSVKIGEGVQISAGAIVITETKIGDYCIINTGASVDHECILHDGSEIAPHATLCGMISVGRNSWIGANATVLPRIKIGDNSVVGAGAVVVKDVPDGVTVIGNPAKRLYNNA